MAGRVFREVAVKLCGISRNEACSKFAENMFTDISFVRFLKYKCTNQKIIINWYSTAQAAVVFALGLITGHVKDADRAWSNMVLGGGIVLFCFGVFVFVFVLLLNTHICVFLLKNWQDIEHI